MLGRGPAQSWVGGACAAVNAKPVSAPPAQSVDEAGDARGSEMMMSITAHVVEAHGARIPLVGLGTWELRGRACARVVEEALRLGYRHIDTAELYDNEREVGEGLRAAGIGRDGTFVPTKAWPSHFAPRDLERSAQQS